MLNAQGRVLFDFFITPENETTFLLDCDLKLGEDVVKHLSQYKLRSKVEITDVSKEFKIWCAFGKNINKFNDTTFFSDPRIENMGKRSIQPAIFSPTLPQNFTYVSPSVYHLHRILNGVPEGSSDFVTGQALPFECNLDYLNAISFDKGCYLGQELTARTHYKGVIRKRLFPLMVNSENKNVSLNENTLFPHLILSNIEDSIPSPDKQLLTKDGQKTGKIFSGIYNVGLGMIRLEHLEPQIEDTVVFTEEHMKLRVLKPHWWHSYQLYALEMEKKMVKFL